MFDFHADCSFEKKLIIDLSPEKLCDAIHVYMVFNALSASGGQQPQLLLYTVS